MNYQQSTVWVDKSYTPHPTTLRAEGVIKISREMLHNCQTFGLSKLWRLRGVTSIEQTLYNKHTLCRALPHTTPCRYVH